MGFNERQYVEQNKGHNNRRFLLAFAVSRTVIFEVEYGAIASNSKWHFSTAAAKFNRPKTDWNECGQAQDRLLTGAARAFWKKWDKWHCKTMDAETYAEMVADVEKLKEAYPQYIEEDENYNVHYIPFNRLKDLSMTYPKR